MVIHQTVTMTQPVMIQHNRSKDFQKPYPVVVIFKNGFAAISTQCDMIERIRKF